MMHILEVELEGTPDGYSASQIWSGEGWYASVGAGCGQRMALVSYDSLGFRVVGGERFYERIRKAPTAQVALREAWKALLDYFVAHPEDFSGWIQELTSAHHKEGEQKGVADLQESLCGLLGINRTLW